MRQTYVVTRDGYVFIENVGQVFVNGLTLSQLEDKLLKLLAKVYSSLSSDMNATSYLDVSLGGAALIPKRIFALGDVLQPGAYETPSSTTLFSSLFYFNGPTRNGSLRNIQLIRNKKVIGSVDYYSYLLFGRKTNDIQIQKNDIVFIPKRGRTVAVKGEILRPAIYELNSTEKLSDLIEIAGGVIQQHIKKRLQITRILPFNDKIKTEQGLTKIDINLNDLIKKTVDIELFDGDTVQFFSISKKFSDVVTISGDIMRPGTYQLTKDMKVLDLIEKADGLKATSFLENATVTRLNKDSSLTNISINLAETLENDPVHNISLFSNDIVKIYNSHSMKFKSNVSINGHVLFPGEKTYKDSMTVLDLIFRWGF